MGNEKQLFRTDAKINADAAARKTHYLEQRKENPEHYFKKRDKTCYVFSWDWIIYLLASRRKRKLGTSKRKSDKTCYAFSWDWIIHCLACSLMYMINKINNNTSLSICGNRIQSYGKINIICIIKRRIYLVFMSFVNANWQAKAIWSLPHFCRAELTNTGQL